MALKALMLKKKIDQRKKALDELIGKVSEMETRESELAKAIEEATTDEETKTVEEEIDLFNSDKAKLDVEKKAIEDEIAGLEGELKAEEEAQDTTPVETPVEKPVEQAERKVNAIMDKRNFFARMDVQTRNAVFAQDDVKNFLEQTRTAMRQKRAVENIGLTIPEVFIGYIRENIENYSKLMKHVTVRRVSGEARLVIMPREFEAIWTECCANLNEMSMTFADLTVDCYKVGGYYAVCNASLEDSDIALASEILEAIGSGIGYALDKAILFGKNTSTNNKMPEGIVTRLLQTEQPSDYPATARTWEDLHESNVVVLSAANSKDVALFTNLVLNVGNLPNSYAREGLTWVMNPRTRTKIIAESMAKNASGAVVSALNNTMPVIGGGMETLDFMPANMIVVGYYENYLLAERAGAKFATSEHVRFLQDQTVFKGTARYDGKCVIPESFMIIMLDGGTASSAMTFAADTANA